MNTVNNIDGKLKNLLAVNDDEAKNIAITNTEYTEAYT
jgi:hypothetical protein